MGADLAVLIIHGMGEHLPGYADPMIGQLKRSIARSGQNPSKVAFAEVTWSEELDIRQREYMNRAVQAGPLGSLRLRRAVVNALGDATAYQKVSSVSGSHTTYDKIHALVSDKMSELYNNDLAAAPAVPLLIIAHSLGARIISNYIWDMQHNALSSQLSDFERLDTLSGIVTFGCNIPLFTFAYQDVDPIAFPPPGLTPQLSRSPEWRNYYSTSDILAYPLKAINARYDRVVTADIPVRVGRWFQWWNPGSHAAYWEDRRFTNPVGEFIASYL
ncbi:MAG: hypothetical protein HRU15_01945 [Planctomycetes bacterium]|nr:hypothetical protein [Planctomycetota bacterium]